VFLFSLSTAKRGAGKRAREAPVPVARWGLDYAKNSLAISTSGSSSQNGGSIYGQYFLKGTAQKWSFRSMFRRRCELQRIRKATAAVSIHTCLGPASNIELRKAHVFYYFEPMIGPLMSR